MKTASRTAELLAELIAFDTQNPMGDERPLARRLADELGARGADAVETHELTDAAGGTHAWTFARWGTPKLLVNVHIDTVPANTGWTGAPHVARFEDRRVIGLGSADTKGAAAAVLTALDEARPDGVAVLFSGDEEHANSAMRAFLASPAARGLERAIVCEPTELRVGTRHRGVMALDFARRGAGGHSSNADRMPAPVADLARAAVALDDWGRAQRRVGPPGFEGLCLNVARLAGGVAFNVVPDDARLSISLRPAPGSDAAALKAHAVGLAEKAVGGGELEVVVALDNPPFATRDLTAYAPLLGAERVAAPIDMGFWTEAALLSAAGIDAVVFGPGAITSAHAPDESVEIAQLEAARAIFVEVFRGRG